MFSQMYSMSRKHILTLQDYFHSGDSEATAAALLAHLLCRQRTARRWIRPCGEGLLQLRNVVFHADDHRVNKSNPPSMWAQINEGAAPCPAGLIVIPCDCFSLMQSCRQSEQQLIVPVKCCPLRTACWNGTILGAGKGLF